MTTNEIENITWAITRLWKPRSMKFTNGGSRNIESSAAPMTTSGVAVGITISRFEVLRPKNS